MHWKERVAHDADDAVEMNPLVNNGNDMRNDDTKDGAATTSDQLWSNIRSPQPPSLGFGPLSHPALSFWRKHFSGWRFGVLRSTVGAGAAFVFFLVVFLALFLSVDTQKGSSTIFKGRCDIVRASDIVIHLVLNVCSTLVLGASNYCMQGLCAPTREDVDKAHARGRWLDIGIQSWMNLRAVRLSSLVCWVLLGLASLPLHWVFNAVFFSASEANQYSVAVVVQEFFTLPDWEPTIENSSPDLFPQDDNFVPVEDNDTQEDFFFRKDADVVVQALANARLQYQNSSVYARLNKVDCINAYATSFLQDRSNIVVVTNTSNASQPVLWSRYPARYLIDNDIIPEPFGWICHDLKSSEDFDKTADHCTQETAMELTAEGGNWTVYGHPVAYCISQIASQSCTLYFNDWIMLMVVVFVAIELLVMLKLSWSVLKSPQDTALRTMGDAVASFLRREDESTNGMCLGPMHQVQDGWKGNQDPVVYHGAGNVRWARTTSQRQWWTTLAFTSSFTLSMGVCLYFALAGSSFSNGLGRADIHSLTSVTNDSDGSSTLVPTILIASLPQLVFSAIYLAYNNLFTRLLLAAEWRSFSTRRRPLRVSGAPRGAQKSTRMLGIPGKYAISIMVFGSAVHWFLSQSLYLVRVDGVDSNGVLDKQDVIARLGYSSLGIMLVLVVMTAALGFAVGLGWFRRLHDGMPGDGSNSVIISAACHPCSGGQNVDTESEPVMWGDIGGDQQAEVGHCSFSAGFVSQPTDGRAYQ
ncbi:hypothetical protein BJ170DRAFT_458903 [Xylariales sp. AK1849]|nr:hypothetical protein BJ170DRAFT_458903 [Xylariales sp. AK1849]